MGRWGTVANSTKSMGGGGRYIRLKDGDAVKFAVTDAEIGQQITYWKDGEKVSDTTPGGEKNTKIVLCVYDLEARAMRVLQITPNTFRTLAEKIEEFGESRIYRIKRYRDQKNFVAYAIDQIDRLDADVVERIAREHVIDILAENDVSEIETVAAPAPVEKHRPAAMPPGTPAAAEKPRTPNTSTRAAAAAPPDPDADIPF